MDPVHAARRLEDWFAVHGRELPWRRTHEPYDVLVTEFILQQTRLETGLRYRARFLERFPTLEALARAKEAEVLRLWSGLGYYARARNLRATARRLVDDFAGRVPSDPALLLTLPGIGPYTAGAIASIAYNQPEPALDGNQVRVLGRVLGVRDPDTRLARKRLEAWSRAVLAAGSPRRLNQALMDLGSLLCLPRQPRCEACPLSVGCRARTRLRAVRRRRAPRAPLEEWTATIHARGPRVWLIPPRTSGLLAGLWLPPLRRQRPRARSTMVQHAFSHRRWRVHLRFTPAAPRGRGRWVSLRGLPRLPHSTLTRRILEAAARATRRPRLGPGP